MPDPEPLNEAQRLATLQLLGEASEAERERLQTLLEADPELAEEQAQLAALTERLEAAHPEEEFPLPDNVLAALEEDRRAVLEEARTQEPTCKTIPFPRMGTLAFAIAAALAFGLFLQTIPRDPNSTLLIASHAEALELARRYPPTIHKGVTHSESQEAHQALLTYLHSLRESGRVEELEEILQALPESAQAMPEFKRLRREAQELKTGS